jgi:hypothetical protein
LVDQGAGEVQPALHAARVGLRPALRGVGEPDELEQRLGALAAAAAGDPVEAGLQLEQLAAGLHRIEADLLEGDADPAADLGAMLDDVEPGHGGAAAGRRQQRAEHPHGGRLAGAVGPQKPEHLARGDRQVDVRNGLDPAVERAPQGPRLDRRVAVACQGWALSYLGSACVDCHRAGP